jgi:predicted nucleotidyltransferase
MVWLRSQGIKKPDGWVRVVSAPGVSELGLDVKGEGEPNANQWATMEESVRECGEDAEVWVEYPSRFAKFVAGDFTDSGKTLRDFCSGAVKSDKGLGILERLAASSSDDFMSWFSGSKVVDPEGQPLVVFHGSTHPWIASFDKGYQGKGVVNPSREGQGGFFFSSDKGAASYFSDKKPKKTADSENISVYGDSGNYYYSVGTRTRNMEDSVSIFQGGPYPTHQEAQDAGYAEAETYNKSLRQDTFTQGYYLALRNPMESQFENGPTQAIADAKAGGYDGVIARNVFDGDRRSDVYIALEPEQIKSVRVRIASFRDRWLRRAADFSEGITAATRELVVQVLMENGDQMLQGALYDKVAADLVRVWSSTGRPPISFESAKIYAQSAVDMLFEVHRIDREGEPGTEGMVYLQSDLQMLADQIYGMIYWNKDPMTLEQITAAMKDSVRRGRTPQAYDNQQIDGAINSALNYLIDDEHRVKVTEHGFVAADAPKITVDEAQRGEFQPKPGSTPVQDVLRKTKFVDPEKEKNRLLDEFSQGKITREVLDQKLRRLQASFRARWFRRARKVDWDEVRSIAQQVRGQFVAETERPSEDRCVEINKALAQALRGVYGDAVALRYGPFTDDRGGEFHHWWVELNGRVIDAAADQFNPGIIQQPWPGGKKPMPDIYVGPRASRYRAESFYSGGEIDEAGERRAGKAKPDTPILDVDPGDSQEVAEAMAAEYLNYAIRKVYDKWTRMHRRGLPPETEGVVGKDFVPTVHEVKFGGSRVKGKAVKGSDWDFLVAFTTEPPPATDLEREHLVYDMVVDLHEFVNARSENAYLLNFDIIVNYGDAVPDQGPSVKMGRLRRLAAQNFSGYVGKWFKLTDELRVWARAAADQSEEVPSITLPKGQKIKIMQAPFQLSHGGKPWVMRISWPTEPVRGVDPGDGEGVVRYDDFHYAAMGLDESDDYHDFVIKSIEWKNSDKTLGYARWETKRVSGGVAFAIDADGSVVFLESLDDPESVIADFRPEELRAPLTEAIQAETLPKGERPGQMRTTDVPVVDPEREKNRLLDEFSTGKITREDLGRKIRMLEASFRARWFRRAVKKMDRSPSVFVFGDNGWIMPDGKFYALMEEEVHEDFLVKNKLKPEGLVRVSTLAIQNIMLNAEDQLNLNFKGEGTVEQWSAATNMVMSVGEKDGVVVEGPGFGDVFYRKEFEESGQTLRDQVTGRDRSASFKSKWFERRADIETRIPILIKQFFPDADPKRAEARIRELAAIDPTGKQGKYLTWLLKNEVDPGTGTAEDLRDLLAVYDKAKSKAKFPAQYRDINRILPQDLKKIVDEHGAVLSQRELELAGQKVVRDDHDWKITEITSPASASALLKGRDWCVKDPRFSEQYLADGPLYLVEDKSDGEDYLIHPGRGEVKDEENNTPVLQAPRLKLSLGDDPHVGRAIKHMKVDVEDILRGLGDEYEASDIPTNELDTALGLCMEEYESYGYLIWNVVSEMKERDISSLISQYMWARGTAPGQKRKGEPNQAQEDLIQALPIEEFSEAVLASGNAKLMAEFAVKILNSRWPQAEPKIMANEDARIAYTDRFPEEEALVPMYRQPPPGAPKPEPTEPAARETEEQTEELPLVDAPKPGHVWERSMQGLKDDLEQGQTDPERYETERRQIMFRPWKLRMKDYVDPASLSREKLENTEPEALKEYLKQNKDDLAPWYKNLPYGSKSEFTARLFGRWFRRAAKGPAAPRGYIEIGAINGHPILARLDLIKAYAALLKRLMRVIEGVDTPGTQAYRLDAERSELHDRIKSDSWSASGLKESDNISEGEIGELAHQIAAQGIEGYAASSRSRWRQRRAVRVRKPMPEPEPYALGAIGWMAHDGKFYSLGEYSEHWEWFEDHVPVSESEHGWMRCGSNFIQGYTGAPTPQQMVELEKAFSDSGYDQEFYVELEGTEESGWRDTRFPIVPSEFVASGQAFSDYFSDARRRSGSFKAAWLRRSARAKALVLDPQVSVDQDLMDQYLAVVKKMIDHPESAQVIESQRVDLHNRLREDARVRLLRRTKAEDTDPGWDDDVFFPVVEKFVEGVLGSEDFNRFLQVWDTASELRETRRASDASVPTPSSNPDHDIALYNLQDSEIEPLPKQIWDGYEQANYLGIALECSGDIFRELVGWNVCEGYVGEKTRRIRVYWDRLFRPIEPEAEALCKQLVALWSGMDLNGKSPRLLAVRALNVALAAHDKAGAEAALSQVEAGKKKAYFRNRWLRCLAKVSDNIGDGLEWRPSKKWPPKPGDRYFFEYHCEESEGSADAELWHRTHQPVEVLAVDEPSTPEGEADGIFGAYTIKFLDGFEGCAVGDELLDSPEQYVRPDYRSSRRASSSKRKKSKKGTETFNGLEIAIEFYPGDQKTCDSGDVVDYDDFYGEVKGTQTIADGEPVDVYLAEDAHGNDDRPVFVIHQLKKDKSYDEDKVMLGFVDEAAAMKCYETSGPPWGFGSLDTMTWDQFLNGYLKSHQSAEDMGAKSMPEIKARWMARRASNNEQKLLRELVCTVIGSDSGTTNEAVLPAGTVVGVQPQSNDHTIFFYSPLYSRMIEHGKTWRSNQYAASVEDFRAATDIGYGEGTGYEHGPECFCDECMAKDDMSTHRCPSCGSRECPGDGDTIDCRKPGTMTPEDVPVETRDSLLDRFNRGEIDEKTLRRRMKQISILVRWMRRRASPLDDPSKDVNVDGYMLRPEEMSEPYWINAWISPSGKFCPMVGINHEDFIPEKSMSELIAEGWIRFVAAQSGRGIADLHQDPTPGQVAVLETLFFMSPKKIMAFGVGEDRDWGAFTTVAKITERDLKGGSFADEVRFIFSEHGQRFIDLSRPWGEDGLDEEASFRGRWLVAKKKSRREVQEAKDPAYKKENALISENKKKPEASKPHDFKRAEYTHPNGHPRCLVCGGEEIIGGVCNKEPSKKDYADFEKKLDAEFPERKERREASFGARWFRLAAQQPIIRLQTKHGDFYDVVPGGAIGRGDMPDMAPTSQWRLVGLDSPDGSVHIPLHELVGNAGQWDTDFRDWTVVDFDHGTHRQWGDKLRSLWFLNTPAKTEAPGKKKTVTRSEPEMAKLIVDTVNELLAAGPAPLSTQIIADELGIEPSSDLNGKVVYTIGFMIKNKVIGFDDDTEEFELLKPPKAPATVETVPGMTPAQKQQRIDRLLEQWQAAAPEKRPQIEQQIKSLGALRALWRVRVAARKDWSASFLFDPVENPVPFPKPGQKSGLWRAGVWNEGEDDLDQLWKLTVDNDSRYYEAAKRSLPELFGKNDGFLEGMPLPVRNYPRAVAFLKRIFPQACEEHIYPTWGKAEPEPGHEGDPFYQGSNQWKDQAKDVIGIIKGLYGEEQGAVELEKFLGRLKPGEREDFLEEAAEDPLAGMIRGFQDIIDKQRGVAPKAKPSPKSELFEEHVKEMPMLDEQERQERIDALLDQLPQTTSDEEKRQIEQRIRSLRASLKSAWLRSAARKKKVPKQEPVVDDSPAPTEPDEDDIIISESRRGYSAWQSGKEVASADKYDTLLWRVKEYMDKAKFWPNVWDQGERGNCNLITSTVHSWKPPVPPPYGIEAMTLAKNIFAELSPEELQGAMQAYNSYPNGYQGAMRRLSDWAKSNTGGMEPDVPEFTDSSFWEGVGIQVVRMVEEEQKKRAEEKIKNQTPSAPTERGPDDVPVMDPAMNQKTIDRLLDEYVGADPEKREQIENRLRSLRMGFRSLWFRRAHCGACHEIQFAALHTLADIAAEHPDLVSKDLIGKLSEMTSGMHIQEFADELVDVALKIEGTEGLEDKVKELRNKAKVLTMIENGIDDGDIEVIDEPKEGSTRFKWLKRAAKEAA